MASVPRIDGPVGVRREGPSAADWELHRGTITELYVGQGKTLKELMHMMQTEHNFTASAKMFNNRFKWWGISKNMRAKNAVAILTLQTRREMAGRQRSEYLVNGQALSADRLQKYWKRATPSRVAKARALLRQATDLPDAVVVRTPSPSPSPSPPPASSLPSPGPAPHAQPKQASSDRRKEPQRRRQRQQQQQQFEQLQRQRSPSPLTQRQVSPPDELRLPEECLHSIRKFYAGYFEARPQGTRSMGLSSFLSLKERLVRFDSQYQALAYIFVEPPGDIMFRLLNVFYIEMRDQMREHDHFLLPMCLHSVYFLAGDPRGAPFSRLLLAYIKEGSDIYLGPSHPLTTVWARLAGRCAAGALPGRDFFYALGRYINDRLREELGVYNILFLRIFHHFTWTYDGHQAFEAAIERQIAHLDAVRAAVLGSAPLPYDPATTSPQPPDLAPLAHRPGRQQRPTYPPPPTPSLAPQPTALTHTAIPTQPPVALSPADAAAVVHPADLAHANEIRTVLSGSLAFGLYVSGLHGRAREVAGRTLAREAVGALPAVQACLRAVVANIAFAAGDVAGAVADARRSLRLSEQAGAGRLVVVSRLSRLAVFLRRAGDAEGAADAQRRIDGLLVEIGA
ncbi:hypothetical protein RB595_008347 [Gaeumannomyces hyphopodioides]